MIHRAAAALRGAAFFCANADGCQGNANMQDSNKNRSCNVKIRRDGIVERIKDVRLYAPEYRGRDFGKISVCAICLVRGRLGWYGSRATRVSPRLEFRSSASNSNFTLGDADVNSLILCAMEIRAIQQIDAVLGAVG